MFLEPDFLLYYARNLRKLPTERSDFLIPFLLFDNGGKDLQQAFENSLDDFSLVNEQLHEQQHIESFHSEEKLGIN